MSVRSFALLAALMPLLMVGCGTNVSTAARAATLPVQFLHYAQMGLPEQDVYVEPYSWLDDLPSNFIYPLRPHDMREEIPSNFIEPRSILAPAVVRVDARGAQSAAYLAKHLFAAETVIAHDLSQSGVHALGPFAKGDDLGLTLRQWLAAQGTGVYEPSGDRGELNVSFQGLVPYGQYALQCVSVGVTAANDEVETDCPRWSALQTSLQPDAEGNAALRLRIPVLPQNERERTIVLQLVYEPEVTTWNGDLGGYGWNQHVQLVCTLPAFDD